MVMTREGKMRLTDAIVRKFPAPLKGNKIHWDSDVPGLGIRVTAADARAFVLNYRTRAGRARRYTIGAFPDWSTVGVRDEARRLRRLIDQGGDPLAGIEAERDAPTMAELIDRFISEHLPRLRPETQRQYRMLLRTRIRPFFGSHTKVADVAFADVDRLHRKIDKPYVANRATEVLRKMFALAIRWGMRPDNPAQRIARNPEIKRKRYLSSDELTRLIAALAASPDRQAANIIRMLLLTGARVGEVVSMRWDAISEGVWTKPASATKQKADHVAPLSAPAQQLLAGVRREGTFVFPGNGKTGHVVSIGKSWRAIKVAAGINGLRVHDLRHSFASQLASGGASLPLIGALLGHASPRTTARYAHLFMDPQRAAVERVGAIVTGTTPADVVSLPARK
jgi:integrase